MNKYLKTQIALTTAMIVNEKLSSAIVTIEFLKADDSVRKMHATTKPEFLPDFKADATVEVTAIDMNLVKVFDIDKKAWRSFKIDRLKSINGQEIKEFLTDTFQRAL